MKNQKYFLIGLWFLLIQVIAIVRNYSDSYIYFFWFCDFAPMLFAIAFFMKKDDFVKGLINIGLFAQIIFLIDFFYNAFNNISLLDFMPSFSELSLFYILSTFLLHISTFIALVFTYKTKPSKNTLFSSIWIIIGLYALTLIFTSPIDKINYVYSSGDLLKFAIPYYTFLWPFIVFIFIVLPTQGLQYLIWKIFKKK